MDGWMDGVCARWHSQHVHDWWVHTHTPGIRVAAAGTSEDRNRDAAIQRAASEWVEAARGTVVRFVLPHDGPEQLTLVPVAAREEGVDEGYEEAPVPTEAVAAGASPAVVGAGNGKVVVGGVVARAPTLRKKRPASPAVAVAAAEGAEGAGEGAEGSSHKKVKS